MEGSRLKRLSMIMAAAAGLYGGAVLADTPAQPEVTKEQLLQKLNDLQAKIDRLETKQSDQDKAAEAAKVDATVRALVNDADKRSQLIDTEGWTAGYTSDKGFIVRSTNGDFSLHPWAQFSFRNVTNYREENKSRGDDNTQNGFEVRRAKIGFDGNLWGDSLKYTFIWATDRNSGALGLEEAWFIYKIGDVGLPQPISVQVGQFKNYFTHEAMNSSKKIFAAERSYLNDVFTGGDNFIQGVGLLYNEGTKGGPLRAGIVFNDGSNDFSAPPSATPRNFQDFPNNKWDWGAAGRVEYKFFGDWKHYEDFTAATTGGKDLLVAGAAVDYSEAGDFGQFLGTADVQYKSGPLALYGAVLTRSLRHGGNGGSGSGTPSPATAGTGNFFDYGFVGKAGYMLDPKLEIFGQYSYTHFDGDEFAAGVENTVHEITGGMNYYLQGHTAKFTLDLTWLPNGAPVASTGGDILAQPNGKNELVLRAQFQLLI